MLILLVTRMNWFYKIPTVPIYCLAKSNGNQPDLPTGNQTGTSTGTSTSPSKKKLWPALLQAALTDATAPTTPTPHSPGATRGGRGARVLSYGVGGGPDGGVGPRVHDARALRLGATLHGGHVPRAHVQGTARQHAAVGGRLQGPREGVRTLQVDRGRRGACERGVRACMRAHVEGVCIGTGALGAFT